MRSYCRLKIVLTGFFLTYLAVAFAGLLTQNKEIFPFFSWLLFVHVPNAGDRYEVLITGNGGQTFSPPIPYNHAANIARVPQSITAYQFIQKMGRARDAGRTEEFNQLKELFQKNFFIGPTNYQLMRVHYDPLERWHGKEPVFEVIDDVGPGPAQP